MQPCPRGHPVALDGGFGEAEHLGSLGNGEPGEIAQLDDLGLPGVACRQPCERLIQGEQVFRLLRDDEAHLVERNRRCTAAALLALLRAGVVDEHTAHGPCGDAEEVLTVHEGRAAASDLLVGLVDEGRGVERFGRVAPVLLPGEPVELVVDDGDEAGEAMPRYGPRG